jgi:putative addiction module component (TIGR02574 family)
MGDEFSRVEADALRLSAKERALLARQLIESLDPADDVEIERLWAEEAERRYQEYKKGNIPARSAEEVFRDAYRSIQ